MDEQSLHTDTVHDWITGYLTNSLTPEEMQSFQEWLNASEENRKYFSETGSVLGKIKFVRRIGQIEEESGQKVYVSIEPYKSFYPAEEEHQDYYLKHPEEFEKELIESGRKQTL